MVARNCSARSRIMACEVQSIKQRPLLASMIGRSIAANWRAELAGWFAADCAAHRVTPAAVIKWAGQQQRLGLFDAKPRGEMMQIVVHRQRC